MWVYGGGRIALRCADVTPVVVIHDHRLNLFACGDHLGIGIDNMGRPLRGQKVKDAVLHHMDAGKRQGSKACAGFWIAMKVG